MLSESLVLLSDVPLVLLRERVAELLRVGHDVPRDPNILIVRPQFMRRSWVESTASVPQSAGGVGLEQSDSSQFCESLFPEPGSPGKMSVSVS
jgi:hypothetical protein